MIKPNRLKIGDTIGVCAPSDPLVEEEIQELEDSIKKVEETGFKVKLSKNIYSNTNGYSATAKERAEDLNNMFKNKDIKMIWFAQGGENSNSLFEYIDYDMIKNNPKIICGYSDITSITNIISAKTELVTFSGMNFKGIATHETNYSYKEALKRFVDGSLELGTKEDKYICLKEGIAEGELIGGNLSLIKNLTCGKYCIDFTDKILFIEELGFESMPSLVSNNLYFMKQNGVFDKIKGLWIGNYEHESGISLEKIVLDTIGNEYDFPIIKSNNFGHIDTKTVIPIGIKARIDTSQDIIIKLIEKCIN